MIEKHRGDGPITSHKTEHPSTHPPPPRRSGHLTRSRWRAPMRLPATPAPTTRSSPRLDQHSLDPAHPCIARNPILRRTRAQKCPVRYPWVTFRALLDFVPSFESPAPPPCFDPGKTPPPAQPVSASHVGSGWDWVHAGRPPLAQAYRGPTTRSDWRIPTFGVLPKPVRER